MRFLPEIFRRNREWAARQVGADPDFFSRLARIQTPEYLWIGCSDSRVPANQIIDMAPGQVFVHRNIANLVSISDPNCMAVVEYAVRVLGVRHAIVCGHYRCGGVRAALDGSATGAVAGWLRPLRDLAIAESATLGREPDDAARWAKLCELSVAAQVRALAAAPAVREARAAGLRLHGWIYDVHDGLLRDLEVGEPPAA
jgi:carbonic anhydrase